MAGSIVFLMIGIAGAFLGFMQESNELTPMFQLVAVLGIAAFLALFIRNLLLLRGAPRKQP